MADSSGQQIIVLPYEVIQNAVFLSGSINSYKLAKIAFLPDAPCCLLSSLQASLLVNYGFIPMQGKSPLSRGEHIPTGTTVIIERISVHGLDFRKVKFTVAGNTIFPVVINADLLNHKGDWYIQPENKQIILHPRQKESYK